MAAYHVGTGPTSALVSFRASAY